MSFADDIEYLPDNYYYDNSFEEVFIEYIPHKTEKAYLVQFSINHTYWVPKSMVLIEEDKFYIKECFLHKLNKKNKKFLTEQTYWKVK